MKPMGILEDQQPVQPAPEGEEMEAEGVLEGGEGGEVEEDDDSPAESNPAYAKAMDMVMAKLYDEDISDGIAKAINQSDDKAKAIVEQAKLLLDLADDATQGSVPDELYLPFAFDVFSEVVEIAQAAGTPISGSVVATATREFITVVVEDLGGDLTQVKEAMAQINPDELGASMEQAGG